MQTNTSIQPSTSTNTNQDILVLGGTGKTGRRIVTQLQAQDLPVRVGSRSSFPPFDWEDPDTWQAALRGASSVYISYHPDLAAPGAPEAIQAFVNLAKYAGVEKLVLLSGRGEEEAQRCERIVQNSGIAWTILRCSWFNQNFSESFMRDMVLGGTIALPAADIPEPFVDTDDIADVAVAALTEDRHKGQLYELTGPELLTFEQVAEKLTAATGRSIQFQRIPREAFLSGLKENHVPEGVSALLDYLFTTVLDGRNANLCDGVQRALGRPPRSFDTYARNVANHGLWTA